MKDDQYICLTEVNSDQLELGSFLCKYIYLFKN